MTALKNPRWERFAQEFAKGVTAVEAYERAGYKRQKSEASVLHSRPEVRTRIAELQDRGAKRAEVTIESLIREADEIQRAAVAKEQFSAATSALTAKAKLAGLWVEKNENTNRNVNPTAISDAELASVIASERSERTSAPAPDTSKLN